MLEDSFRTHPGSVGVVEEHTAESHKLRIDTKKQEIANLEIQMKVLYERIFELDATLSDLKSKDETENVKDTIDALYVELDILQDKTYEHFEIPEKRHQKLLDIKQEILVQYNNTSLLNDVFVDHLDESIQVIIHSNDFELHKNNVLDATESIASENFEDVAGNIDIEVKHVTLSVGASDLMCSEMERKSHSQNILCGHATIAFPATKGSDNGFVTVGHAFGNLLSITAGAPTYQSKVYQPGPDSGNIVGSATVPVGQSLSDLSWQATVIGTLNYGTYKDNSTKDTAFVKLATGKTVDATVKLWRDRTYSITSYESTDSQSIGSYVYQTGAATGYTSGHIISTDNARGTYASYNECKGDSSVPVGQYSSSFKLYGMHVGKARDIPGDADSQTASCATHGDGYSVYLPYDTIASDLGIVGITR